MMSHFEKSVTGSTSTISKLLGYVFCCPCICTKQDEMSILETQLQRDVFDMVFDDPLFAVTMSPSMDNDDGRSHSLTKNP